VWDASLLLSLCFPTAIRWAAFVLCASHHDVLPHHRPQNNWSAGLKPLKLWTRINLFSLWPDSLRYFVTVMKSWRNMYSFFFWDYFVILFLGYRGEILDYQFKTCFCYETGSYSIVHTGLKHVLFLLQPRDCWDYRYVPLCLERHTFVTLGFELRDLPWLGRCCTTWAKSPAQDIFFCNVLFIFINSLWNTTLTVSHKFAFPLSSISLKFFSLKPPELWIIYACVVDFSHCLSVIEF
jgi:hypothetical protein